MGSSQTRLNTDSLCCVPCSTLRNALLMKNDFTYTKQQLSVARDSISLLKNTMLNQDSIIYCKDTSLTACSSIKKDYIKIISNKDTEIKLYKKEVKKQKNRKIIAYTISIISILLGTYIAT